MSEKKSLKKKSRHQLLFKLPLNARAKVSMTPGLPLIIPNVPSGLSVEKTKQIEVIWIHLQWSQILAERWRIQHKHRKTLRMLAEGWKRSRGEVKRQLVYWALREVKACANAPWTGRIGSGTGSRKVNEIIFGEVSFNDERIIAVQVWLAQEALAQAEKALSSYRELSIEEEQQRRLPRPKFDRELFEKTGRRERVELTAKPKTGATKLENIVAADDRPDLPDFLPTVSLGDIYKAVSPRQRQILKDLLHEIDAGKDLTEARRAVANKRGISAGSIDQTFSRIRRKLL